MSFEKHKIEEYVFEEAGVKYPVWVLKAEANYLLRGFVGYNKERKLLYISDETPQEFRHYILTHEILCCELGAGKRGRCLAATQEEFNRVPLDMRDGYSVYRGAFYRALVTYHVGKVNPDRELIEEIMASRSFWEAEVAKQY